MLDTTALVWANSTTFHFAGVQDIFSTLGKVSEVRLFKDSASGISQGSAFVKFQDQQAAALAVQTISGRVLCDKVRLW